jgi:hypothetical protein
MAGSWRSRASADFNLSVDATNEQAVMRLRERKHRYGKPLAVMVRDVEAARALCELSGEDEKLLLQPARPIVLARARSGNGIAPAVAPGIPWLGVFLPNAPLQHLLFAGGRVRALVMTSANLSEEPIAIDNDEARTRLANIADEFLMHNREILQRLRRLRCRCCRWRAAVAPQGAGVRAFFEESIAHLMRTFEAPASARQPRRWRHQLRPGSRGRGHAAQGGVPISGT